MSYLRALDTARSHLDRGDLLAAETALAQARDQWRASRVRVPLVERGLEPALRRVGGWFGRSSTRPILPVFGHRAELLEDDLAALARLLREEVLAVFERSADDLVEADRVVLENALRLDRRSQVFSLDRAERWRALRGYLDASRRLARRVEASLLPTDLAGSDDEAWLRKWCEAVLDGSGSSTEDLLAWIERQASALGQLDGDGAATWCWVSARAALSDPVGGERALGSLQRALEAGLDPGTDLRARRLLAGLLSNETVLAGPGADVLDALERWRPPAGDTPWPPAEVRAVVDRRRAVEPSRAVVSATWDDDARHLALVLHDATTPHDVLVLAPRRDEGPGGSRFEASLPEARGWIQRWLPEGALVLVGGPPPPHVADLLAGHPVLDVDALVEDVPADATPIDAEPPGAPHPLWNPGGGHPDYQPLARRARDLVPRFRAWATCCPAFSEDWGRDALDVMAEHGLELCGTLRSALDRVIGPAPAADRILQTVELVVPLRWPRLEARPWPAAPGEPASGEDRLADGGREGCVWFDHVPSVEEVVGIAWGSKRAEVLTPSVERARAIAGRAARRGDARRVTVAPARVGCPEAGLAELDAWMRTAVGDTNRQRDVLWLWRVLAESPNGEVTFGPGAGERRARVVRALEDAHAPCGPDCRLTAQGGCWPAQLEGRRETATVWVAVPGRASAHLDGPADVLVDDLRAFVVEADDERARDRLARVVERVQAAGRAWTWARSGRLDPALRGRWAERIGRPLVPGGTREEQAPAVLLAPPGYRPGDPLLAAEANALIERRTAAWDAVRDERTAAWTVTALEGALSGAGREASVDHVYTARLADDGADDELVLLLRAAAAQAHARTGWACLDPRLAALLGHHGGTYPDVDEDRSVWTVDREDAVATTVADGRRLLEERTTRPPSSWGQPITPERLRALGAPPDDEDGFDADALAEVLRDWGRGRSIVVGGATDRQRSRSIELVRVLAERSGDGGPLGVRCVFVVGLPTADAVSAGASILGPGDTDRLGAVMLEAERGRVARVDLHPSLLRDDALRAWARRVSSVAWVFPRADAVADDGSPPDEIPTVLSAWREVLERSGAAALVFVDAVDHETDGDVALWAQRIDARMAVLPAARARDRAWTVTPETVGPVTVACWRCTRSVTVEHAAARCPSCHATVADDPASLRAAADAVEDLLVHRLHGWTPRAWWALTSDAELAACVRERLGLAEVGADREPLLAAVAAEPDDPRILHVSELDGDVRPPAELLWLDVPAGPREMRRVLRRLAAMEAEGSRLCVLVPPVGLHTTTPHGLRGRWRWTAKRTEVEFRLRALDARRGDVRETLGLRPDAPGPALRGPVHARRRGVVEAEAPDPRPSTARVLDALEAAGIAFGRQETRSLDVGALPKDVTDDDVLALLRWGAAVDVLEGTSVGVDAAGAKRPAFERALRAAPGDGIAVTQLVRTGRATSAEIDPPPEGAIRAGIGRANDDWLEDAVRRASARGERTLVVVGAPTGRARWQSRRTGGAEVVAVEELAMAFLDSVAREKGIRTRTRLLPAEGTAEGEETRMRLMRETSRRYARVTGRIPALEAQDLRRAVQGESKSIPGAVAVDVDVECLDRCAAEARAEAGWLTAAELREASVNALDVEPELVERWRRRYPRVAVDGVHDLSAPMRAFVRALFPDGRRWETFDPLLGDDPAGRAAARDGLATDLPRETVRAIEVLRRNEPDDLGRIKARGRGRAGGRVESVRVLTLRAAADWIVENVPPDRDPDRTGVVVADPGDRAEIAAALRRGGLDVTTGEGTAAWLADGPRQALAALHLVTGTPKADLLEVLVRTTEADETTDSASRFERWQALGRGEPAREAAELRWARLHGLRGEISGTERLRDAVEALLDVGSLDPVLDLDAAGGRLRTWVEDHAHRTVDEVLSSVRPEFLADPAVATTLVHVLGPEDLVGPDHDHLVAIGTGFEPVVRTVRVLLRAPQHVTLLYSERDPLG